MKVLSFEDYKATGKIKYVETHVSSSSTGTNGISVDDFLKSELEEMSYIMEMSTDELVGELSLITHTGQGLRELDETSIVSELSNRLLAIEYILMLYAKNKLDK
tara:strand:- start:6783 stop:7094 length:312 start_codon:yes stop_codon:yes gene_type:complete